MKFASVTPYKPLIERQSKMINYHIHNWLPLNSDNYKKYQNISILSERINFLEKILIGNILSLQKESIILLTFHYNVNSFNLVLPS